MTHATWVPSFSVPIDEAGYVEPFMVTSPNGACPFDVTGAHDFDAHTSGDIVIQLHCRKCGLIVPPSEGSAVPSFVHTYKGEGLTACGLEVVGPCPDCERAT